MTRLEIKNRLKKIIDNRINLALIFIFIAAIGIRIYFFIKTSQQAVWWDEADYLSAAKHWAFGLPYQLNPQRPPIFQLLGAILMRIGFSELTLKFFLSLIPSTLVVFFTYLLGETLFDKYTGLIGAIGAGFIWPFIFWSNRFQPDFFSISFQLLALTFFWKSLHSESTKLPIYSGVFAALGFYFKISALLIPLSMGVFAICVDGLKSFKIKKYWLMIAGFIIALIPFLLWQYIAFGNPVAFAPTYSGDFNVGRSFGWMTFDFYYLFAQSLFFWLFIIGLILSLIPAFLAIDLFIKEPSKRKDGALFSILFLIILSAFYVFYIKGDIEDRWVFLIIPFIFFLAAKGINWITRFLRLNKILEIIFVTGICLMFIIIQFNYVSPLIDNKISSYAPIKEASLLMKENTEPTDKVLSISYTQTTYYSDRETITYAEMPFDEFKKVVLEKRPAELLVSIWEPHHPQWMIQQKNNEQGYRGIFLPYFNSTIIIGPNNQFSQFDIKQKIIDGPIVYELIYPKNQFNGAFLYKISYLDQKNRSIISN